MAVYETFILKDLSELTEGEEHIMQIRDAETFEPRVVKAIVSSSLQKLPGADSLRVRWQRGQPFPKLWAIKIIEDLGSPADHPEI